MGMFDYVKCDYPLPGTKLEFVTEFQSKDFDCTLAEERILEDGTLEGREDFTGTIEFYGSNICAMGPAGQYTRHGEDAESVCYEVTFVNGKLKEISQTSYKRYPALASTEMHRGGYGKGSELDENASFLGQKLYVLWGGDILPGYEVEVVYETDRELCVKSKEKLEIMHRHQIGRTIFKDAAEAEADREYSRQQIEQEKVEYQRKISEKNVRGST